MKEKKTAKKKSSRGFSFRFPGAGGGENSDRDPDQDDDGDVDDDHGQDVEKNEKAQVRVFRKEDEVSWVSRTTFAWFWKVVWFGSKNQIVEENLGGVGNDDPVEMYEKFVVDWEEEVKVAKEEERKPNMVKLMMKTVGYSNIWLAFGLAMIQGALVAAVPFISKRLLDTLAVADYSNSSEQIVLACGLVILPFVGSFCQAQNMYISRRGSMHLYGVFTQAIFNKSLRLSAASRNTSSSGQLVNLIATDAGTALERAILMIYPLFLSPILLAVLLYLVGQEIGISLLAGFACLFVALPINVKVFIGISKAYAKTISVADHRIKIINEALQAIRVLKMYAWENRFVEKIRKLRQEELKHLKQHAFLYSVGLNAVFLQLPYLIQYSTFATYYALGNPFYPSTIFTVLQLLQALQQQVTQLPSAISQLSQTLVAAKRITEFLLLEELQDNKKEQDSSSDVPVGSIILQDASFTWDSPPVNALLSKSDSKGRDNENESENEKQNGNEIKSQNKDQDEDQNEGKEKVLQNISLNFEPGSKNAIIAPVAHGKSSLLLSLSGELRRLQGSSICNGSMGLSTQKPFVLSMTLRDNILFGKPMNKKRYKQVVQACQLEQDIQIMPHGDLTAIGENGVSLSGGQKARVSLARTIYADTDIVLLDCPLAAVDAHVGAAIFRECLMGPLLKGKTLVMVTNKTSILSEFDNVLVLENGFIKKSGPFDDSLNFEELVEREASEISQQSQDEEKTEEPRAESENQVEGKLYEDEEEAVGTLKLSVLQFYIKNIGRRLFYSAYTLYVIYLFTPMFSQYVLSFWTDESLCQEGSDCQDNKGDAYWFFIYSLVLLGGIVLCLIAAILIVYVRVSASRNLHDVLLVSTFSASITDFFDVRPIGRILNRFAKDMSLIDFTLSMMFMFAIVTLAYAAAGLIGILLGVGGWFTFVLIPIVICYAMLYRYLRRTTIQLQRIESKARSPIYSNFSEVLNGLATIRAFSMQNYFISKVQAKLSLNIVAFSLARVVLPAALMVAVNFLGAIIMASVCIIVLVSGTVAPGQAGLAITYALQISQTLNAVTMVCTEVEVSMNSVERIKSYSEEIEPEDPLDKLEANGGAAGAVTDLKKQRETVTPSWPDKGVVVIKNLTVGYRSGPDIIHEISLAINSGEKIGVCGRSGAGKSSLTSALLRIVEPRSGSIEIDGVDILKISLQTLRSRIALIPQEATVFQDTIRFNLDPFNQFSDQELNEALEKVHLDQFVGNLDYELVEGGENISNGQRQIIAFLRALLRQSKLLLLDEATASLSPEADQMLTELIRTMFAERTVITIAHRLAQISTSDRVLVLDKGCIVEFDKPDVLLANPTSQFASMVEADRDSKNAR